LNHNGNDAKNETIEQTKGRFAFWEYNGRMASNAAIRVGPAGWSYEDWKGIVYPAGTGRGQHPAAYLAQWFDTIEINATFYRPPDARHAASWVRHVSDHPRFKFTAKLWERFTHTRDPEPSEDDVRAVRAGLAPLVEAGRFGALLIQFPWRFKRTPDNRAWLARLLEWFDGFPLAVELRHDSWDRGEVHTGLRDRRAAFCNIDQPQIAGSIGPSAHVTAPLAYVRFHGRNEANWFREDAGRNARYDYLYSPGELAPWIARIASMRGQADEIYVITNNHYRGQAVVNALEIQHDLGVKEVVVPRHLIDEYPRLKRLFRDAGSEAGTEESPAPQSTGTKNAAGG